MSDRNESLEFLEMLDAAYKEMKENPELRLPEVHLVVFEKCVKYKHTWTIITDKKSPEATNVRDWSYLAQTHLPGLKRNARGRIRKLQKKYGEGFDEHLNELQPEDEKLIEMFGLEIFTENEDLKTIVKDGFKALQHAMETMNVRLSNVEKSLVQAINHLQQSPVRPQGPVCSTAWTGHVVDNASTADKASGHLGVQFYANQNRAGWVQVQQQSGGGYSTSLAGLVMASHPTSEGGGNFCDPPSNEVQHEGDFQLQGPPGRIPSVENLIFLEKRDSWNVDRSQF